MIEPQGDLPADPVPDTVDGPAPVGPAYGGSADTGVVQSVGEHDPAAGDVVDVVLAEHRKLEGVFEELLQLVDAGEDAELRRRGGGVVRELLEHEAAEQWVVLPAADRVQGAGATAEVARRRDELVAALSPYDELNPDVDGGAVRDCIGTAREHLRTVEDVVVPLLRRLPAEERMRLGEDLRQVVG